MSMKSRRLVCFMLVCILLSNIFVVYLSANDNTSSISQANNRISTNINMAKAKNASSLSGVEDLTANDLIPIGVYLSNFYVPLSTQVGESTDKDGQQSSLVSSLMSSANFSQDMAEKVVSTTWTMSANALVKKNPQDTVGKGVLFLGTASEDFSEIHDIDASKISFSKDTNASQVFKTQDVWGSQRCVASYANLLILMNSGAISTSDSYGVLYYISDSGDKQVVFDFLLNTTVNNLIVSNGYTTSSFMYHMTMRNLRYDQGIGSALWNVASLDDLDSLTQDSIKAVNAFNSQLYYDCFGNILLFHGFKLYVLFPSCVNPYTFASKGSTHTNGDLLNLTNLFTMAEASKGNIYKENGSYKYKLYTSDNSNIFNNKVWRVFRGTSKAEYDLTFKDDSLTAKLKDDMSVFAGSGKLSNNIDFPNASAFSALYDKNGLLTSSITHNGGTIDNFIVIDTVASFVSSTIDTTNSSTIFGKKSSMFDGGGNFFLVQSSMMSNKLNTLSTTEDYQVRYFSTGEEQALGVGVYLTYLYAFYQNDETFTDENRLADFSISTDTLPYYDGVLNWDTTSATEVAKVQDTQSLSYLWLHPKEGLSLIKQWARVKLGGILVGIHEDMVGNGMDDSSAGAAYYTSFAGYISTPELNDLEWTSIIFSNYDVIMFLLIVIICIILIANIVLGNITFQKSALALGLFVLGVFVTPIFINTSIGITNRISDSVYGSKFFYWAISQHQEYYTAILEANNTENYDDYLSTLFNEQVRSSGESSTSVTLKWICPKKDNYLMDIDKKLSSDTGGSFNYMLMRNVFDSVASGQSYLDNANSTYLYRSYTDIANYSSSVCLNISDRSNGSFENPIGIYENGLVRPGGSNQDFVTDSLGNSLLTTVVKYKDRADKASYDNAVLLGFNYDLNPRNTAQSKRWASILSSSTVKNSILYDFSNLSLGTSAGDMAGIGQEQYKINLRNFKSSSNLSSNDIALFSFGMFTESVFYYLSWNLYDQASTISYDISNYDSIYRELLLRNNMGYFFNTSADSLSGEGQLKDFTDMKTLFTLVIPYLKAANDKVIEWDNLYGMTLYDEYPVSYSYNSSTGRYVLDSPMYKKDSEEYYKWWHNLNVARLYNQYTPWVDLMYSCDYAKPETISYQGKKVLVEDPINPASYPGVEEGRPMIFSYSEMEYYGLRLQQLTSVEQRILKATKSSYEDLVAITNYYTYNNDVLNTAIAMIETFNFNEQFSETHLFKEDAVIYPQCFELKNFSYDAYLRLILQSATNETLSTSAIEGSFYDRVVQNAGLFFGVLLLPLDFLCAIAVPLLKFIIIVALFLLALVMLFLMVLKLQIDIKSTLINSLVKPLLQFCTVTITLSLVVSLFMSNGGGNIANTGFVISLGDPTITVALMILINALASVCYALILWGVVKDAWKFGKAVTTSILGTVGGALTTGLGLIGASTLASKLASSASSGARNLSDIGRSQLDRKVSDIRARKQEKKAIKVNQKVDSIDTRRGKADSDVNMYNKMLNDAKALASSSESKAETAKSIAKSNKELYGKSREAYANKLKAVNKAKEDLDSISSMKGSKSARRKKQRELQNAYDNAVKDASTSRRAMLERKKSLVSSQDSAKKAVLESKRAASQIKSAEDKATTAKLAKDKVFADTEKSRSKLSAKTNKHRSKSTSIRDNSASRRIARTSAKEITRRSSKRRIFLK